MAQDDLLSRHIVFSYNKKQSINYVDFERTNLIKTLLPGMSYEITVQYADLLTHPAELKLRFLGLDDAVITGMDKALSAGSTPFIVPEDAVCAKLEVNKDVFQQIQSIKIKALPAVMKEGRIGWESGWESYLIWSPSACAGKSCLYARKTFDINDLENIADAKILATADNECLLYLNGCSLGKTRPRQSRIYEVNNGLKKGNNLIAFEVSNNNSPAVLSAEISINYKNGKTRKIITDDSWKISDSVINGWEKNDFNDSNWKSAEIVGTPPYPIINRSTPYKGNDLIQVFWNTAAHVTRPYIGTVDLMTIDKMEVETKIDIRSGDKIKILTSYIFPIKTRVSHKLALELYNAKGEYLFDLGAPIDIPKDSFGLSEAKLPVNVPDFLNSGKYSIKFTDKNGAIKFSKQSKEGQIYLNVTMPAAKGFPESKLVNRNGLVTVEVNNQVVPFTGYYFFHWGHLGFGGDWLKKVSESTGGPFIANGINFRSFWIGENKYDFSCLDTLIYRYLQELDPSLSPKFIIEINLDPPAWWCKANPDELIVLSDGKKSGTIQSIASLKWRSEAGEALRTLVRHLSASGYANRLIGIRPTAWGPEWMQPGSSEALPDYSSPARDGFCQWIRKKYQTDECLKKAWNQQRITIDTVRIPELKERQGDSSTGIFADPTVRQNVLDYYKYYNDIIADTVIEFCKIIKEESANHLLSGTYYGYSLYLFSPRSFSCGHYALQKVLASPYVDFVSAPEPYGLARRLGSPGSYMIPFASPEMAGKMYLVEVDFRTFLSRDVNRIHSTHIVRPSTVWDSIALMKRSLAKNVTTGLSYYWYDFGVGDYNNENLLKVFDIGRKMSKLNIELSNCRYSNDVAVVVDERAGFFQRFSPADNVQYAVNQWGSETGYMGLNTLGIPVDIYDFSSLYKNDFPEYKCVYFLNSSYLTAEDRNVIRKKIFKNNTLVIFKNSIGFFAEKGMSAGNITDITGINIDVDWKKTSQTIRYTSLNDKFTTSPENKNVLIASTPGKYKDVERFCPSFYINDSAADILAVFDESKRPAIACKNFSNWSVIYSAGVCPLDRQFLRKLLKNAKVHFYSEQIDDCVYANNNFVGVHGLIGGKKHIYLKNTVPVVYDIFKKKILAENCKEFDYQHEPGDTAVFYIGPKDKISELLY